VPFVENQGATIYWDEQGSGEPLLLIMGLGWTSHMWYRTRAALVAAGYRTIAFDNRGVGQSSIPAGPYPLTVMASDAAAVLTAAGVERAHIHGVSMGGMIAQEFALQYPERVATLTLGCTQAGGANAVLPDASTMQALMRDDLRGEEAARAVLPFIYAASTPQDRIEEDLAMRLPWLPTRAAYMAQLQGVMAWHSYDRLDRIQAPALVLHGDADRLVPYANGKLVAGRIAGAKFVTLPGAAHIYQTDFPGVSERVVVEFLGQHRLS
jgi:pimeloyl-ACP methyl ester carboxylesterase